MDQIDFSVRTTKDDLSFEEERPKLDDLKEGQDIRCFPNKYLETLAVYRKIIGYLLEYNILLLHGSVISVDGIGYLFTAKSGTGKSTHTRLWRETFKDRATMINDDKLLQQVYHPNSPTGMIKTLHLIDQLTEQVKLYQLRCNIELDAAMVAYRGMN